MKKLIPIFLALSMMFSGCGILEYVLLQENVDVEQSDNADSQQTQTEKDQKFEEKNTQNPIDEGIWPTFQRTATIEETVLVDEYDVRIIATGISYDSYSAKLGLIFENNSEKDICFTSGSIGYSCNSVNGYMLETGYINCDVVAGKKAKGTISFDYDLLMLCGIYEIADIEIGFDIRDDDYNHIYSGPRQVKTSIADGYDYEVVGYRKTIANEVLQNMLGYRVSFLSDEILYNQNGLAVVYNCLMVNANGEAFLMLEVENSSAESVVVTSSDIYLNGLGIYSSTWSSDIINPGKTGAVELNLSDMLDGNSWDAYGLQEIGAVSLSLNFTNTDGNFLSSPAVIMSGNPNALSGFDKGGREVYNSNDIRIVMKDIVESDSDYRDDMYILFYIENNAADTISLNEVYKSFSVNGYMMDYTMSTVTVKGGTCSALEIMLWESDLEENGIASSDEINEIEFSIEIRDSYNNKIDEAVISVDNII